MGWLRAVGNGLGVVADKTGHVLGTAGAYVTDSPWVGRVLRGAGKATRRNLEQAGSMADGAADIALGIAKKDTERADRGVAELGRAAKDVAQGVVRGAKHTGRRAVDGVGSLIDGDKEGALEAGKDLAAFGAASILAVGLVDSVSDGFINDPVATSIDFADARIGGCGVGGRAKV